MIAFLIEQMYNNYMPALTVTTEALRITKATEALSLMAQGKTQQEACAEVGITPKVLRYWLGKEDKAIESIRDMTIELEKSSLADIIIARSHIVRRIADVVSTTPLPVRDLVVLDQHLKGLQEELETKYGAQSQDADAQAFLLNGPTIEPHESVFSAKVTQTQTTIEIKQGEKMNEGEIIDAQFEEEEEGD
jgi:hypothetical protein